MHGKIETFHGQSRFTTWAATIAVNCALSELRRPEEIDCDRFLEYIAPLVDGRVDDAELREKLAHYVRQCPECNEELELVKKSLEP